MSLNLRGPVLPDVLAPAPNGVDDTAALQAALNATPDGAALRLRAGTYLVPNGGLSSSKKIRIVGTGAGTHEGGGSRIECSSATATVLSMTAAGGWSLADLAIVNTSGTRPTAGAGLYAPDADWCRIDRVLVDGFWNNIQIDGGYYYSIADSAILNPRNYGLYMRNTQANQFDHADQTIEGCTIAKYGDTTAGGTAVRWESGGGLRFVNNKINARTQPGYTSTSTLLNGLQCMMADGGSTSVLVITGNSIENCTGKAIEVGQVGTTGKFEKVVVTGNEIALGGYGFYSAPSAVGQVGGYLISGNVFTDMDNWSIFCQNNSGVTVGPNYHVRVGLVSGGAVKFDGTCTNHFMEPQNITGDNVVLLFDNSAGSSHGPSAIGHQELARDIPFNATAPAYTNLYRITSAGMIRAKLVVMGAVTGGANFGIIAERILNRVGGGAVVATTVGTDTVFGTVVDYQFDVSTTTGDIIVGVKVNTTAGGTDVKGRATLSLDGQVYTIKKGS